MDVPLRSVVLSAMMAVQGDIMARQADPSGCRAAIQATLEESLGHISADIGREIHLAEARESNGLGCCQHFAGGGNYLAALGLLSYTEYMGSWITGKHGMGTGKSNLTTFFELMGTDYAQLAEAVNVYDVFRNGMAHRYTPKAFCDVHMLGTDLVDAPDCGIVRSGTDWPGFHFVVRKYFQDFRRVADELYDLVVQFPALPVDVTR